MGGHFRHLHIIFKINPKLLFLRYLWCGKNHIYQNKSSDSRITKYPNFWEKWTYDQWKQSSKEKKSLVSGKHVSWLKYKWQTFEKLKRNYFIKEFIEQRSHFLALLKEKVKKSKCLQILYYSIFPYHQLFCVTQKTISFFWYWRRSEHFKFFCLSCLPKKYAWSKGCKT